MKREKLTKTFVVIQIEKPFGLHGLSKYENPIYATPAVKGLKGWGWVYY